MPSFNPGPKHYLLSWKRIGTPCAMENLVEQKSGPFGLEIKTQVIQIGPHDWIDEKDHPELKNVSGNRFRPIECDEITIAVKIWQPQS